MAGNKKTNNRNGSFNRDRQNVRLFARIKNSIDALRNQINADKKEKESNQINANKREKAKTTDIANTVINGLLAFFTAALFLVAVIQMKDSKRAADAAVTAVNHQIETDSINRINDSIKQANDSAKFAQNFQLSKDAFDSSNANNKKTFQQQITAFNETKTEFEKEHQSFLITVPHIDIDEFKAHHRLMDSYDWYVIGEQPIRVDSFGIRTHYAWDSGFNSRFSTDSMNVEAEFNSYGISQMSKEVHYLVTGHPETDLRDSYGSFGLPSEWYKSIIAQKRAILFIGKVYYTNLVTKKRFVYNYLVKIDISKNIDDYTYRFVFNQNKIIK